MVLWPIYIWGAIVVFVGILCIFLLLSDRADPSSDESVEKESFKNVVSADSNTGDFIDGILTTASSDRTYQRYRNSRFQR